MSGGSYNYIGTQIEDISLYKCDTDPRRIAFQKLLKLVGRAMHEIEWVDSCDRSPGDEFEAIDKCFAFLTASPEIIAKAHAFQALAEMIKNYDSGFQPKVPSGWTCMCGERVDNYKTCVKCKGCKRHHKGICDAGDPPVGEK